MARFTRLLAFSRTRSPDDQRIRAQSMALTLFAGPWFALAWIALPHDPRADEAGILVMCAAAWAMSALLMARPARRVPDLALQATLLATTVVISVAIYFAASPGAVFFLYYLWATPFAYCYFSARHAALQTAWVAVCFAAALLALGSLGAGAGGQGADQAWARWLFLVGTVTVVGTLVRQLTQWGRESDTRFRRGFDDSRVAMTLVGTDLRLIEVNDAMCRMLGRPREVLEGMLLTDVMHPEDAGASSSALTGGGEEDLSQRPHESRFLRPDGTLVLASVTASAVRNADGRVLYWFGQVRDITTQRRDRAELERRGRQQQAIARLGQLALRERDLDGLADQVVATVAETLDVDLCSVLELRPEAGELEVVAGVGWREGVVRRACVPAPEGSQEAFALASEQPVVVDDLAGETRFRPAKLLTGHGVVSGLGVVVDGREGPFGLMGAYTTEHRTFTDDDVAFIQAVANVLSSAVDRRRSDDANRHAALHDPLTGLANRTLALDRLRHALAQRPRDGLTVAVLVLDLDRFKVINDSLGHDAGDELLLSLAPRLREAVRPGDTVGRLGGDEFVVVCEGLDSPRAAIEVAERLGAAVSRPFVLQSGEHFVTSSIGVAVATSAIDTPEELVRDADAAMYRAKERGRGCHELFDESMRRKVLARLRVEAGLRRALEHDELRVHYQPIVDARTGRPQAVEALVRWQHPERGVVGPLEFIPVAEETGLIIPLDRWVLETAGRQMAAWQELFGPLELCVNVSGRQIANPLFSEEVADVARAAGLLPGTLGLEITESVLIEEAAAPVTVLTALHERGLRLLLDDFGTGYSSLSYLRRFPLDTIKLDRSFARGLGTHPEDAAIVQAVVSMAKAVNMTVVAEGVETRAQLAELQDLGCDRVQGYLFARPMPAQETEAFLRERLGGAGRRGLAA